MKNKLDILGVDMQFFPISFLESVKIFLLSTFISPFWGLIKPTIVFKSVVFPQPFKPNIATTPFPIENETFSKIVLCQVQLISF